MIIVLDLEQNGPEIIEIGAVKFDWAERRIIEQFETLVRPYQPLLQSIQQLTGITPELLRTAPRFEEAYYRLVRFCGSKHTTVLAGWGSDAAELRQAVSERKLPWRLTEEQFNIARMFREKYGVKEKLSLQSALKWRCLEFEGRPHRALPDARNTTRLLMGM